MTSTSSSLRRDVLSAYAASGAKVLSWVIVSAMVFRVSWLHYGFFALVRGTTGLLNYTTIGLAPAMIRLLGSERNAPPDLFRRVFANGIVVAAFAGTVGVAATLIYGLAFDRFHVVPVQLFEGTVVRVVFCMGFGAVLRLMSEAAGAVIQMKDRVTYDNLLVLSTELLWPLISIVVSNQFERQLSSGARLLEASAIGYAISGALLLLLRAVEAERLTHLLRGGLRHFFDRPTIRQLVAIGLLVAVAQMADFLYAPTDYILINHLISPGTVAYYAPAVQIDAGLLLLVGALAAVLLPKTALAHAGGDIATLRRYYIRGTLLSLALLFAAGVAVYFLSPWIFHLWLGDPMPRTQAILPLVLLHTILGGSSGVGRSILLGMGKVKPFAAAALIAGVANVVLSYSFVKFFGLGLNGIVYGTILAVFGRCVLWQPWYVLRTLKREAQSAGEFDTRGGAIPEAPL